MDLSTINLIRLQEECCELAIECMELSKIISKVQRFGAESIGHGQNYTALERLITEVADVQVCIENLQLSESDLVFLRANKRAKLDRNAKYETK